MIFAEDEILDKFLAQFGVDRDRLQRLTLFLLAHAWLDRWLATLLGLDEFTRWLREGGDLPPGREPSELVDQLTEKHAAGTFGPRLRLVSELGLLSGEYVMICKDANDARNHFLHWRPNRPAIPKYHGVEVTSREGLDLFVTDVSKVIEAIIVTDRSALGGPD